MICYNNLRNIVTEPMCLPHFCKMQVTALFIWSEVLHFALVMIYSFSQIIICLLTKWNGIHN